jgi:hypothetical protein
MKNYDYQNWSKTDLIEEIKRLKKRKKYGVVWEDKPEEVVEVWKEKLPVGKEIKSKEILNVYWLKSLFHDCKWFKYNIYLKIINDKLLVGSGYKSEPA